MAGARKRHSTTLKEVVSNLIDALGDSGQLPQKIVDRLSDQLKTANSDPIGCCTFMMAMHTYHANMTEYDCGRLRPPGTWEPAPC